MLRHKLAKSVCVPVAELDDFRRPAAAKATDLGGELVHAASIGIAPCRLGAEPGRDGVMPRPDARIGENRLKSGRTAASIDTAVCLQCTSSKRKVCRIGRAVVVVVFHKGTSNNVAVRRNAVGSPA